MRFPPAGWAWPPGPRVAAAHNSGVDGRRDGREKGPMQATSGPQRDKTRPAARLGGPPGTKLSQHAPKRRFRPTFRMQGELCTASATNNPSRENFIPHAEPLPVQNSPSHPARRPTRYKTLPASGLGRPTRYKTLPARPKTPISAHLSHAGRTLYRFRHQQPEQGELYPACGATSGTKLSQQAALTGPPGTKLSQQAPKRRFRPTFRMQGELCTASATNTTSREKKVTHQHPTAPTNAPLPKFRMQFD